MISSFGQSCIRSFEYTVGPIDPDPDDEHRFLEEVANLSLSERSTDRMVAIAHDSGMYDKCAEPVRTR